MELDDKYFNRLLNYKEDAKKNIAFLYMLSDEYRNNNDRYFAYTLKNRAQRIDNCINYWQWDKYKLNKVKKLKLVNRCKDKFCPNCRIVNISQAIVNFIPAFKRMITAGYTPYHLVLTIPNTSIYDLSSSITNMNSAFAKLWRWIHQDFTKNGNYYGGYKDRLFNAVGAIKVLEITVQKSDWNYFHVHYHVIIFLDKENKDILIKDIPGGYQHRSDSDIYYSLADLHFMKLWKKAYDDKNIKEMKFASDDWKDNYICNITEITDEHGIHEVFKYCFKDVDIKNLEVFKCLLLGLRNKRIRQGYGDLYNVKVDDKDITDEEEKDDIKNYLEYKDELPVISANNFRDNFEKDKDYKKVSLKIKSNSTSNK